MNRELAQGRAKNVLYAAGLIVAEFYLLVAVFRHFEPAYDRLFAVVQWASLLLIPAALLSCFAAVRRARRDDAERKRLLRSYGSYEQIYLIFVFFWYIVSVAVRQYVAGGQHFKWNDAWMYVSGMVAFLFFPFIRYDSKEKGKRIIEIMIHTLVIPYALLSAWIIWNYFRMNYIRFPSGQQLMREAPAVLCLSGLNHMRLGEQALIMIGTCLYMMLTQKPGIKIIYAGCFAANFVLLVLTNARTSWYMAVGMLACAAFLFCWNRMEKRKNNLRIVIGILAAVAVILCCQGTRTGLFQLLKKVTTEAERTEVTAAAETKAVPGPSALRLQPLGCDAEETLFFRSESEPHVAGLSAEKPESSDDDYIRTVRNNRYQLNERFKIYKACLFVMFTSRNRFLFGVTPSDIGYMIKGVYGVDIAYSHAHNFFIQMGISYGVPTMIATIVFAVSLLVRSIRILFINRKKLFPGAWMICLTVLFCLGNDMLSARLNASPDFFCAWFYLLAGWLVSLDMDTRAPKQNGKHAWF